MNFKSESLSNEELECKYRLFCSSEAYCKRDDNLIKFTNDNLNQMIEKKIRLLKLIDHIYKDICEMKKISKRCEKSFKSLQDILKELF